MLAEVFAVFCDKLKFVNLEWLPFAIRAGLVDCSGSFAVVVENNLKLRRVVSIFEKVLSETKLICLESFESDIYESVCLERAVFIKRAAALNALLQENNFILFSTIQAMNYLVPQKKYFLEQLLLCPEQRVSVDGLEKRFVDFGYVRVETVERIGEFAVRGGIVDIFPSASNFPVRIDFCGDVIESIREFREASQISFGRIGCAKITRCLEMQADFCKPGVQWEMPSFHEETTGVATYLPIETKFIFDFEIEKLNKIFLLESQKKWQVFCENEKKSDVFCDGVGDIVRSGQTVFRINPFENVGSFVKHRQSYNIKIENDLQRFLTKIDDKTIFSFSSNGAKNLFLDLLSKSAVDFNIDAENLLISAVQEGFQSEQLTLYTENEIFGKILKFPTKKKNVDVFHDYSRIKILDYVVHEEYGVAIFEGIVTLSVADVLHDFLSLLYKDNARLYIPVENISLISRYGENDSHVELDVLKGSSWKKRKNGVRKKLLIVANNLLTMAAKRKEKKIQPFQIPDQEYEKFCKGFGYIETDDQLAAVDDVMGDFQNVFPAERLICGDVGFGKTEVALRAAFVVAMNLKQVVLLAPTTILVFQHYKNFLKRFEGFGLKVCQLSRFTKPKERKETIEKIKSGDVNVVIATHAVLSNKIKFFDLGMIIIDEEQHFGVKQKAMIREQNESAHLLTLSATPIPRTLQMAVAGIFELSIIATPPIARLPIKTFVANFDARTIKNAIENELASNGQVFFVTPRVEYLTDLRKFVSELFPEARVAVVFGAEPRLEETIVDFCEKNIDILISTNIIDSGIDIPNANTIIVHRADLFGLAQLHQLRGRVGRQLKQAYAYFLLPEEKALPKNSQKRLDVLLSLDRLGSGFSLASHDLEIRGAGNMLGDEQSGYIKDVGVELYQVLLEEAILMLKTENACAQENKTTQINLGVPVFIPSAYIDDADLRLEIYRKIGSIKNEDEIESMQFELIDRFGRLPEEVCNLFDVVRAMCYGKVANIEKIDVGPAGLSVAFFDNHCENLAGIIKLFSSQAIRKNNGSAKIRNDNKIIITKYWKSIHDRTSDVLTIAKEFCRICAKN